MFHTSTFDALRLAGLLAAAAAVPVTSAVAATPALIWQDVSKIAVQCLVQPGGDAALAFEATLCKRVSQIASRGAPAPVGIIAIGDPAILSSGTVTLLVHASVARTAQGRLVAFTIRPFRASAEQTSVFYGTAPRAVSIPSSGAGSPALDAAVRAALSETLPWLAKPEGARLIAKPQ